MSYELLIVDAEEIPELSEFMESREQSSGDGNMSALGDSHLSPKLVAFLAAVNEQFPSLQDDPANSPWSMTPAHSVASGGSTLGFSIGNSERLFDVFMEFEEIAWLHDLIICDPQEGTFRRPRQE